MAATEQIKNFICAAETYRKNESSKCLAQLQRHVKILFVVSEPGVFSGEDRLTCDFYLSLHRLLSALGANSQVTWLLLRLLEHLCADASALALIRDRYCFLPVVSNLLTTRPEGDRSTLLLSVCEALTAHLTLSRYEPWVRPLLRSLSDLVCEAGEPAPAALRVLSQLVHAGPGLSEALLAAAHRRRLSKALLAPEGNLLQQLHAAELLLALQPGRQPLPLQQLRSFADLVFSALSTGLAESDVKLMTQAGRLLPTVLSELAVDNYPRLEKNVATLLNQVRPERHHHAEFVLRPLEELVRRGAGSAEVWRPAAGLAASLLDKVDTVESAAGLLEALLRRQLLPPASEAVAAALTGLQRCLAAAAPAPGYPQQARAAASLLNTVAAHARCRAALAENWSPQLLRQLLQPLPPAPAGRADASCAAAEVVVATLELARALGSESAAWLEAQHELARQPPVLAWLAQAVAADDRDLVRRALSLVGDSSLSDDSVDQLADSLSGCHRGALPSATPSLDGATAAAPYRPAELSQATAERVNALLERLQGDTAELKEGPMLDVMELYEFKVAALTERLSELEQALDAASSLHTSARLQLAQASAEGSSVRRLLLAAERRVEALHASGRAAERRASAADAQLGQLRDQRAQHERQAQAQLEQSRRLERELAARSEALREAQQAAVDTETRRRHLAEQAASLTKANDDLRAKVERLTGSLQAQEQAAGVLRTEVNNLELLCKSQELSITEKERDYEALLEENRALKKIQDMIHSISSKSKDKASLSKVAAE